VSTLAKERFDMKHLLETNRLRLRRWTSNDLEPFAALNADPEVMRHFPATLSLDQTKSFIAAVEAHFEREDFGLWATDLKETGEMIGFVGLSIPRFAADFMPCVEIGWRLSKKHWGFGYAPEAAREVLRYGFEHVKLDDVVSFTATTNLKSIRVMEKIGMRRDPAEDFDHPNLEAGHRLRRHVLYRLSREDWQSRQGESV
jgi:RimJ/RimL family protein N-acetyltransferase